MPHSLKTFYVPTTDGWRLAVHHLVPDGPRRRHPVLMIHGLGANRLNLDLDDRYSIARAARRRGFEVFILELRGAGLSQAPGGRDRELFQWGFDEHRWRDLPAAMAAVLERSGASAMHGVGHSMGGMLFYSLGTTRPAALRSIVAVGAPVMAHLELGPREMRLVRLARRFPVERLQQRVPLRRLMSAAGLFVPITSRLVNGLLLNRENTEDAVMARMAREAIADVPVKIVWEFTAAMAGSDAGNGAGSPSPFAYEAELDRIAVPALVISGSVDRIAPPPAVRAAVERLRSSDVRYREMGRRSGDTMDYGHIDLLVGRRAPEEVFPLLLDFLEEIDG